MILFLDFDGVLHPIYKLNGARVREDDYFCNLPLLEDWLRLNQQVSVVISSSWRDAHPIETLREFFSDDIKVRVIDKCPTVKFDPEPEYYRHQEIMEWINKTNYTGPWLALDDAVDEFPPEFSQLIATSRFDGLTAIKIKELDRKYKALIEGVLS